MRIGTVISITLLVAASLFFGYFIYISEGFHGGGDSLAHFRIAKFSWEQPEWLLDHWGKPLFTLIAVPFAQLGFKGIQYFNLLLGLLTAFLAIGICRERKWQNEWLVIPIIMFSPILMQEFFSGLTEVAFVMLMFCSIWLKLKKRYIASIILLSFLPMIRTEAVLFLAWFGLLELLERRFVSIPLLITGTLVYSVAGWFEKGDFLWLINEMPYMGGNDIYGSGSWNHYLQLMPEKIGWEVLGATLFAAVFMVIGLLTRQSNSKWLTLHILAPALIYLVFHSAMWYMGKVSAGLPRILAVIVPFLAVMCVYGFHKLGDLVRLKWIPIGLSMALAFMVVWNGTATVTLPVELGQEEKALENVADYIRANELTDHKIHYYSLYNEVTLGLDPHYPEQCQQVIHTRAEPHINVAAGSLVIWDAHFAPNEGQMPLENLTSSPYFELLEVFEPEIPFKTINDYDYKVYLFLRH